MKNRRGAGFEIRQSVLWLVSDGVGEEDVDVLLAIVRARLAAKKSRSSFAKEKVWNFIRIVISLKSSLLGGLAIESRSFFAPSFFVPGFCSLQRVDTT